MTRMVYPITRLIIASIVKLLLKKVNGIENIPNKSPFIIVSNHGRVTDQYFIIYLIVNQLNKKVHFIALPKYYFLGDKFFRGWTASIPLFTPKQAYKESKELIKSGEIVGIYPEGPFHRKDRKKNPKTGAIRLAAETKAPILPIGIKYYPFFRSSLNIGKPIYKNKKNNFKKQAIGLMKRVYKLKRAA